MRINREEWMKWKESGPSQQVNSPDETFPSSFHLF